MFIVAAGVVCGAPPSHGALNYDVYLGAGVEANDNVYLAPDPPPADQLGPVESTILTYTPGGRLSWDDREDYLRLTYHGAYQTFHGQEDIPADWIHTLSAELGWRRWSPFFIEVQEERARVPQYQDSRGVDIQNRIDRNTLTLRSGIFWDVDRTLRLEAAAAGNLQTFPQADDAERVAGISGEFRAEKRWDPLWSGTLTLGYGDVERKLADDHAQIDVALDVRQRLTPQLEATYGIAWRRDRYSRDEEAAAETGTADEETDVGDFFLKGLTLRGDLDRGGSWSLAYEDRMENLVTGDTIKAGRAVGETTVRARLGSSLQIVMEYENRKYQDSDRTDQEWGPTGRARWIMTEWLALDLRGAWTRTRRQEPDAEAVVDELAGASAGLVVLLGSHLQLEAGYRHLRNDSTEEGSSYRSNRYYALITAFRMPFVRGRFPDSVADRFAPFLPEPASSASTQ